MTWEEAQRVFDEEFTPEQQQEVRDYIDYLLLKPILKEVKKVVVKARMQTTIK